MTKDELFQEREARVSLRGTASRPRKGVSGWALRGLETAFLVALTSSSAQTLSIDRFCLLSTGTNGGGVYSLSGIIGQPDAGAMSGGQYTLEGGFWGGGQVPGPRLVAARTALGTILLSWPAPSTGFVLEETMTIEPDDWQEVGATPDEKNGRKQVVVAPAGANRFYRLRKL